MSTIKRARQRTIVENLTNAMAHQFPELAELPPSSLLTFMRLILTKRTEVDALGAYARRNQKAVFELTVEDVEEAGRPVIARKVLTE